MFSFRGLFCAAKEFHFLVILFCTISIPVTCNGCSVNEAQSRLNGFVASWSCNGNYETDSQVVFDFHPSSELVLAYPTNLGISLAKLGVWTSFGGFLVQAEGLTVESTYSIKPLLCFDVCPSGIWRNNSSFLNLFNGTTLYAEGVTASLPAFFGNTREKDELILKSGKFKAFTCIMSVLDANEPVHLENCCSQCISVKNTSPEQVQVQLILNSGPEQVPFKVVNTSMFWTCVKKTLMFLFTSVLLYLLVRTFFLRLTAFKPEDFRIQKNSFLPDIRALDSLHMHSNLVISFAMSSKMKVFLTGEEVLLLMESFHGHCLDPLESHHRQTDSLLKLSWVDNSDTQKESNSENLSVEVGKEKRKNQRKKKSIEASSSNSSASSSLSPVASRKPLAQELDCQYIKSKCSKRFSKVKTFDNEVIFRRKNHNMHFSGQKKPNLMRKVNEKGVLLPSTCHSPVLASMSKLALHERAPGRKIHNRRIGEVEAKKGFKEKFTYDIWGDHLFGHPPIYQSKVVCDNSMSFFVRDLQTVMKGSMLQSVS